MSKSVRTTYSCSFCGRDKSETQMLIAGINAHICEVCIEQCMDIIDEELYKKEGLSRSKLVKESEELKMKLESLRQNLDSTKIEQAYSKRIESLLDEIEYLKTKKVEIIPTTLTTNIGIISKSEVDNFFEHLAKENIINPNDINFSFSQIMNYLTNVKRRERKYFAEICFEKISNAEIKEVIKLLIQFSADNENGDLKKEILHISSKWNSLTKDIRKGIIKLEDSNLETNKINAALIEIVEQIEFS